MKNPHPVAPRQSGSAPSSERVALALSRAIHEHRLAPGTKLGEDELAEIYGTSRTIIRAALQSLAHVHLVEIHRNRGAFVAKPTPREAREVFEARELIEPRTARMAARKATTADIARLDAHIAEEHAALSRSDPGRALYLSGQLHVLIAHVADQMTVAGIIEHLVARSSLIVALYWKRETALCDRDAHHGLVRAIAYNDEEAAETMMRSHLAELLSALELEQTVTVGATLREILT